MLLVAVIRPLVAKSTKKKRPLAAAGSF